MMRSPEQQYNFAKSLPIPALEKVLEGQSDVVEPYVADMVLRQKTAALVAEKGAQAMQMAQSPKIVQKDLAAARQVMQPRMEQGIASMPVGGIGEIGNMNGAGGGIVAFDDGGPVQHFQNGQMVGNPFRRYTGMPDPSSNLLQFTPEELEEQARLKEMSLAEKLSYLYRTRNPFGLYDPTKAVTFQQLVSGEKPNVSAPSARPVVSEGPMGGKQGSVAEIRRADIEKGGVNSPAALAITPPYIPRNMQMADITPPPVQIPGLPALNFREIGNQALATTQRIMGERPEVPSRAEALYETRETLKAAGYDFDLFKKQIDEINKQKDDLKLSRKEAANLRLLEAGLGIMGGESPYAFVNIGKGASPAAKGFAEDLKDLKKLERDSEKNIRELKVAQNQVAAGLGEKAENRLIKAQERQDKFDSDLRTTQASLATSFAQLMSSRDVAELNAKVQFGVATLPGAQERLIRGLGSGDPTLLKGARTYSDLLGFGGRGDTAARTAAFNTWSKSARLQQEYPNFEDFFALRGTSGTGFTFLGKE